MQKLLVLLELGYPLYSKFMELKLSLFAKGIHYIQKTTIVILPICDKSFVIPFLTMVLFHFLNLTFCDYYTIPSKFSLQRTDFTTK